MTQLNVIVQAGGRGSRLRHHTWNKPKCLVSVRGKPLLYHLFERLPQAHFNVIGDYAFEQLEAYLKVNPPAASYQLIKAQGSGTLSGIADALPHVDKSSPLLIVWSDLIVGELPDLTCETKPVILTTSAFTCRWTVSPQGVMQESPGTVGGIPGIFYFPEARQLPDPPASGEFVRWLSNNLHDFVCRDCPRLEELGEFATIEQANDQEGFSRFFNKVTINETTVEKQAIDPNYRGLIEKELAWYREVGRLGFRRVPKVLSEAPFVMERIRGEHLYRLTDLTQREERAVLADYLDSLIDLHDKASVPAVADDVYEVYCKKTLDRVKSVAAIIPGFERASVTVNGRKCRNPFAERHAGLIESLMPGLLPPRFVPIHGDPTFSNTLVDDKLRTWFIDPRGYFAQPGVMGDPWYDFAKVYYSAIGGYDAFNRKKFKLHIDDETVEVLAEEPRHAATAQAIFTDYFGADVARIEVLHGLIWLALSGYARDDIDSVIGAFYLGLYWLEAGTAKL